MSNRKLLWVIMVKGPRAKEFRRSDFAAGEYSEAQAVTLVGKLRRGNPRNTYEVWPYPKRLLNAIAKAEVRR